MLAHGIDLGDGRAGKHQSTVGGNQIGEGNFVIDGLFDNGRTSTAEQEEDECRRRLRLQHSQNRARRLKGFLIGRGMSPTKVPEAMNLCGRLDRTGYDSFERRADLL